MDIKRNTKGQFLGGFSRGKQSKEVKEKISKANSGKNNGMYRNGHPHCRVCGIEISYQATFCGKHVDRSYLHTPELIKRNTERLIALITNEKTHPRYKGEKAGYVSKHKWVIKHFGKPDFCEACGTEEKRRYHWANISGKFIRDRGDWLRMCVPCHHKFDDIAKKVWKTRKSKIQI